MTTAQYILPLFRPILLSILCSRYVAEQTVHNFEQTKNEEGNLVVAWY